MDTIFFIIFCFLLASVSFICLFYPKQYLKYRKKEVNENNIQLLIFRGILLLLLLVFFIVMFIRSI